MNVDTFRKEKKKIVLYELVFGVLCEVISLFLLGFDPEFAVGIICGITVITVNLVLLENAVNILVYSNKKWLALPVQTGRLSLFGITGYLCCTMGVTAAAGFAAGIVSLAFGVGVTYFKEVRRD